MQNNTSVYLITVIRNFLHFAIFLFVIYIIYKIPGVIPAFSIRSATPTLSIFWAHLQAYNFVNVLFFSFFLTLVAYLMYRLKKDPIYWFVVVIFSTIFFVAWTTVSAYNDYHGFQTTFEKIQYPQVKQYTFQRSTLPAFYGGVYEGRSEIVFTTTNNERQINDYYAQLSSTANNTTSQGFSLTINALHYPTQVKIQWS